MPLFVVWFTFIAILGLIHAATIVLHPNDPQPITLNSTINGGGITEYLLSSGVYIWNNTTLFPVQGGIFHFRALNPGASSPLPEIRCPILMSSLTVQGPPLFRLSGPNTTVRISDIRISGCGQIVECLDGSYLEMSNVDISNFGYKCISSDTGASVNITSSRFSNSILPMLALTWNISVIEVGVGSTLAMDDVQFEDIHALAVLFAGFKSKVTMNQVNMTSNRCFGGCLYYLDSVQSEISNSYFFNCTTPSYARVSSACIYFETSFVFNSEFRIHNTSFLNNSNLDVDWGMGSAMVIMSDEYLTIAKVIISSCQFIGNIAGAQAAAIYAYIANITISDSIFSMNEADGASTIVGVGCILDVKNCAFNNNHGGRVIYLENGGMFLDAVELNGNVCLNGPSAVESVSGNQVNISNSAFVENAAVITINIVQPLGDINISNSRFEGSLSARFAVFPGSAILVTADFMTNIVLINNYVQTSMYFRTFDLSTPASIIAHGNHFHDIISTETLAICISEAGSLDVFNNSITGGICTTDPRVVENNVPCSAFVFMKDIQNMIAAELTIVNVFGVGISMITNDGMENLVDSISMHSVTSGFYVNMRGGVVKVSNSVFYNLIPTDSSVPALANVLTASSECSMQFESISVSNTEADLITVAGSGNISIHNSNFSQTGTIISASDTAACILQNLRVDHVFTKLKSATDFTKTSAPLISLTGQASTHVIGGTFDCSSGLDVIDNSFAIVGELASLDISGGTTILHFASQQSDGGAIWVDMFASLSVSNTSFIGNSAPSGNGGAIFISNATNGGILFGNNVEFLYNSARYGGALYYSGSVPQFNYSSVIFINNTASIGSDFLSGPHSIVPLSFLSSAEQWLQRQVWQITVDRSGALVNNASVILIDSYGQYLHRSDLFFYLIVQSLSFSREIFPSNSSSAPSTVFNCSSSFFLSGGLRELLSNGMANFSSLRAHGCAGTYEILISTDDILWQYPSSQFYINATITIAGCPPGFSLLNPSFIGLASKEQYLICTPCPKGTYTTKIDSLGKCINPDDGMYSPDGIQVKPCDDDGYQLGLCPPPAVLSIDVLVAIVIISIFALVVGIVMVMWQRQIANDKLHRLAGFIDASEVTLGEMLGSGAFGVVHAGIFRGSNVAVKKLHDHFFSDGQSANVQVAKGKVYPEFKEGNNDTDNSNEIMRKISLTIKMSVMNHRQKNTGSQKDTNPDHNDVKETSNVKEVLKSLKREVKVLSSLRHPNIVLYLGACLEKPNIMLIMERLEMGPLDKILLNKRIKLSYQQRLQMALDAFSGMVYLHSSKPVTLHCDIKSSNMLVGSDFTVKVSDFGLSQIVRRKKVLLSGDRIGTLLWMAPEVIFGVEYTAASDVYSMTIVLWEIVYRQRPYSDYEGKISSEQNFVALIAEDIRPKIPNLTPMMEEVLNLGWSRFPEMRPTMADMRSMLLGAMKDMALSTKSNIKERLDAISRRCSASSAMNASAERLEIGLENKELRPKKKVDSLRKKMIRDDAKILRSGSG